MKISKKSVILAGLLGASSAVADTSEVIFDESELDEEVYEYDMGLEPLIPIRSSTNVL